MREEERESSLCNCACVGMWTHYVVFDIFASKYVESDVYFVGTFACLCLFL